MPQDFFASPIATIKPYGNAQPRLGEAVVILDGVRLIGDVTIGTRANIWYNSVVRGDVNWVRIGADTNIQDGAVLHVNHAEYALDIGERVTVGHSAILHACTVEDESLIGMHATVLDGAVIQRHAMVAAGAVVPPGAIVPTGVLVGGIPARPIRDLRPEEIEDLPRSAKRYVGYAREHAAQR